MGGYGSGRWGWHIKKTTVEECRQLSTSDLVRDGVLREGIYWRGRWRWWDARTGETTSTMGMEVDTTTPALPWVRLFYTFTRTGKQVDYKVMLQNTRPYFGGVRWWFTCPLVVNGRPCLRRVRKLYLPPGGVYYGCRVCHDLTYTSCQESDKRISALRRMVRDGTFDLMDALDKGTVDPILALRALGRW